MKCLNCNTQISHEATGSISCYRCGYSSDNKFGLSPQDLIEGYRLYVQDVSSDDGFAILELEDPQWSGDYHFANNSPKILIKQE